MPDWKKIKAEYIQGNVSYRKLAEKYGVSFSSIQKIGASEKWTDLRKISGRKAEEKIVESAANREAKRVDRLLDIADLLEEKIISGIKEGIYTMDAQSIRAITMSIKDLREIKGYKADLDRQEQMARIEKLKKEAQTGETNKDIRVVISGELDEYSK